MSTPKTASLKQVERLEITQVAAHIEPHDALEVRYKGTGLMVDAMKDDWVQSRPLCMLVGLRAARWVAIFLMIQGL